jgi:hypothetical protein
MAGAPRLSTVDSLLKELKKSRRELIRLAKALPDEDVYAMVYAILIGGVNSIDNVIQELKPSIVEANMERKNSPDQPANRARKWCAINDSRRKPSASVETAAGSQDEETP